jgi:hypothetical protein
MRENMQPLARRNELFLFWHWFELRASFLLGKCSYCFTSPWKRKSFEALALYLGPFSALKNLFQYLQFLFKSYSPGGDHRVSYYLPL